MKSISITLPFDQDIKDFLLKQYPKLSHFVLRTKSLDARRASLGRKPVYVYQIDLYFEGDTLPSSHEIFEVVTNSKKVKPIIIGAGPAGLFCALRLAEYGISSIILERGDEVEVRMKKIAQFWKTGLLDEESNVCFGEGGAGLYSDGKLITRIKSEYIDYVMKKFVQFGAPEEIAYLANPHLGSNKIRSLIHVLTDNLKSKGCEIHFRSKVTDFIFDDKKNIQGVLVNNDKVINSNYVVLATGHSAKNIYEKLNEHKVDLRPKDFAVGVRVEHKREFIDKMQLGEFCGKPLIGAARYRLSYHNEETSRGTYSFCMCPGGYVLSSGTNKEGIVTNGMSNNACNSPWSNAALVVSIKVEKDCDIEQYGALAGLKFIEEIEKKAYAISKKLGTGKEIPSQRIDDFLEDKLSNDLPSTSCPSQSKAADLSEIFPEFIISHLKEALKEFNKQIKNFSKDGILLAPETRTSSPITITRDSDTFESTSHLGLYPSGEGAGYAGGITSAAVDGVKIAEVIRKKICCQVD